MRCLGATDSLPRLASALFAEYGLGLKRVSAVRATKLVHVGREFALEGFIFSRRGKWDGTASIWILARAAAKLTQYLERQMFFRSRNGDLHSSNKHREGRIYSREMFVQQICLDTAGFQQAVHKRSFIGIRSDEYDDRFVTVGVCPRLGNRQVLDQHDFAIRTATESWPILQATLRTEHLTDTITASRMITGQLRRLCIPKR